MELSSFSDSSLSLIAPAVAIILAVVTRKVLWSLGAGIIAASLLLTHFNPLDAIQYVAAGFYGVFVDEGAPNWGNLYILLFLVVLGVITSLISISGGARAFGEWARARVKTRQGSQLLTVFLGVLIFIDDYFNSLAVGNVSRPLTDRHRVSRAKLAYLIDSTAAPICVITPISSWGAYIIALVATIMAAHGVAGDSSPIHSFLTMIPMNLYAVFALAMVLCTAWLDLNVGPMLKHENRALQGQLFDANKGNPPGAPKLNEDSNGRVVDLVVPIVVLILATLGAMMWTGNTALAEEGLSFSVLGAFEYTSVNTSLISGGLIALIFTVVRLLGRNISGETWSQALVEGTKSMLPAIYILVFAWVLTGAIGELETGKYLASLVEGNISPSFLPMILFVVSGIMAFATGTSWGTFGIMLPIAGDMTAAADIAMLLPSLAAVLAGAVFGDHCSPISDTTILSSTGASCHHIDHVTTQLPYALVIALVAMIGYLVMGLTASVASGFVASSVAFALVVLIFRKISNANRVTVTNQLAGE